VTALSVVPRHDVPRNPSISFGVPYRRDPLRQDVAPTINDPVNVIMTQSVEKEVKWAFDREGFLQFDLPVFLDLQTLNPVFPN
jgi:hypothetical protein